MRIVFIGDVFGGAGRRAIAGILPAVRAEYDVHLVIANAENVSGGRGIHPKHLTELIEGYGIDLLTSGNHIYDAKEIIPLLSNPGTPLLRPINYPKRSPGRGCKLIADSRGVPIVVVNMMGRLFMDPVDSPFDAIDEVLATYRSESKLILVDFHAEATSEKRAFAWYVNGKVSAVLGTHTHVQTADEEILDGGTAYISDAGMTGPYRSVIGMDCEAVLKRFTMKFSQRAEAAEEDARFSAVFVEIDDHSGKALRIERIHRRLK